MQNLYTEINALIFNLAKKHIIQIKTHFQKLPSMDDNASIFFFVFVAIVVFFLIQAYHLTPKHLSDKKVKSYIKTNLVNARLWMIVFAYFLVEHCI